VKVIYARERRPVKVIYARERRHDLLRVSSLWHR
jgi:hypothetical protein